jgi:hypothetical protein
MPSTVTRQVAGFTVVTSATCPEGSECINALRCVEMGRKCIEGTSGCGGSPYNCCCTFKPPAPPTCPEGSECINALRCVEMGRKCIEGTSGCGGSPYNCCCTFKPPAPPVPPAPPEEVRIPTLIIVVAGIAVVGIAGLALWRLLRRS